MVPTETNGGSTPDPLHWLDCEVEIEEGIYLDIKQLEAQHGTLPDWVTATNQAYRNAKYSTAVWLHENPALYLQGRRCGFKVKGS